MMDDGAHTSRTQPLYGYESTADHPVESASHQYGSRPLVPMGGDHLTALASYIAPPPKTSVPIAEVLNDGAVSSSQFARPGGAAQQHFRHSAIPPTFSGRLSDILIDRTKVSPSHLPHQYKRRKVDDVLEANAPTVMSSTPSALTPSHSLLGTLENNSLTLPKPTTRPVKSTTRRQRIPPLLQGLHQPPPLPPEGRLFPPITGEGGSFGAGIGNGEGLGFRRAPGKSISHRHNKADETSDTVVPKEKSRPEHPRAEEGGLTVTQVQGTEGNEAAKGDHDAEARVTAETKEKETKKRNKWTAEETKDLLTGVSQFGVGKWKKILDCEDFHFNNRTAADLKDRFRTCCPEGGLKATRKSRAKGARTNKVAPHGVSPSAGPHRISGDISSGVISGSEPIRTRKPREGTDRISAAELEQMGIHGPFIRAERRKHRPFTAEDDENLLKGFKKWKGKWHLIRDDEELGFSERHSTDLRDRFRVRYPEQYAEAGKKLKEREKLLLDKKAKGSVEPSNGTRSLGESSNKVARETEGSSERGTKKSTITRGHSQEWEPPPRPYLQPDTFPGPLDDLADIFSESDPHDTHSPITLSRTILDSNPGNNGSAAAAIPNSGPPITQRAEPVAEETATSWLQSADDQHVDPRALNLLMFRSSHNPAMTNTAPAMTSMPLNAPLQRPPAYSLGGDVSRQIGALPQSRQTIPPNVSTDSPSHSRFPSLDGSMARNISSTNTLQRQRRLRHEQSLSSHPNLPTLVVPPVPSSSARNATHNLPRPADLLSMVDEDTLIREERTASTSIPQSSNDEGVFMGMNLAPTNRMNTFGMEWPGQGMEPVSMPLLLAGGTSVPGFESSNLRPFYHSQGSVAGGVATSGNGLRRENQAGHREGNNPG